MSVQIVSGKKGWHLKVDGCFICQGFGGDIVALKSNGTYGATEWVSIAAIRSFWAEYRVLTVHATRSPFVGTLTLSAFNAALLANKV